MAFKEDLKKKIPEDIQFTPEFKTLLAVIKQKNIKDCSGLRAHVQAEIKSCRDWIKENKRQSKEGTMNRHLKKHADLLDFYELINKKILRYL